MSLKVGNTIPRRLYKGSSLVSRVYKGDALQWERLTREGRSFVSPADGEVSLDTIYGKSLVWNQLFSKGGGNSQDGITLSYDTDNKEYILNGTSTANFSIYMIPTSGYIANVVPAKHKAFIKFTKTGGTFSGSANSNIRMSRTGDNTFLFNSDNEVKSISSYVETRYPILSIMTGDVFTNYKLQLQGIDLTLMFGVGNEPSTVEEFEALFPEPYYPYDAGSVIHLGGNPIVWNQLVPDVKINVPIGTYNYASYATSLTFTNGHKYLVALDNSELIVRMRVTGTSYTSTPGQKILVTFTGTTGTGSPYQIQLSGTSTKVSHVKMHDLTMMFGEGNEPATVEEFEKLFPLPYYPYNSGTEMKASTIDIDVKGFNLWDEELQRGKLIVDDGTEVASTFYGRSDYFKLEPDTNYYMHIEAQAGASNHNVLYYDENKNYLGRSVYGKQMQFTTPPNCYYGRIAINNTLNWTLAEANQFKCCINASNPTYNGQYKPYQQEKTVSIPLTAITSNGEFVFPDGICGIGTARDEVGQSKAIKRIGSRAYTSGDESDSSVITDGTTTFYELASPIEYPLDIPFKTEYEIVEGGSESLVGLTAPIKEDIALNYK